VGGGEASFTVLYRHLSGMNENIHKLVIFRTDIQTWHLQNTGQALSREPSCSVVPFQMQKMRVSDDDKGGLSWRS
jgi:hypothetical protein